MFNGGPEDHILLSESIDCSAWHTVLHTLGIQHIFLDWIEVMKRRKIWKYIPRTSESYYCSNQEKCSVNKCLGSEGDLGDGGGGRGK